MMWWKTIAELKQQVSQAQAELQKEQGKSARLLGVISRLQAFGISPTGEIPSRTLAESLIDATHSLLQAEHSILLRVSSETSEIFPTAARGLSPETLSRLQCRIGEGPLGSVARDLRTLENQTIEGLEGPCLLIPLQSQSRCTGILLLAKPKAGVFSAEDQSLAKLLAAQAGLLIEGHLHFESLEHLREASVLALARAIEAKDTVTHTHSDRTRSLVQAVAQDLSLPDVLIRQIEYGAFLHDIGKIGIEDSILKKAGPLTPDEYAVMKQHPRIGLEILKTLPFLRAASAIVLYHQEWYNGAGYPEGLAGNEIPLGARIVQVIDAWDAMTSNRTYRGAMSKEAAIAELRRQSGTQFDPKIVDLFLRAVDRLERSGIATTEVHKTVSLEK